MTAHNWPAPHRRRKVLQAGNVRDVFIASLFDQLGHRQTLQFGDVHIAILDVLIPVVGPRARSPLIGQLFLGVLVARLVGIHVSAQFKESQQSG